MPAQRRAVLGFWSLLCAILLPIVIVVLLVLTIVSQQSNEIQQTDIDSLKSDLANEIQECQDNFDVLYALLSELEDDPFADCEDALCGNYPKNLNSLNLLGCWDAASNLPPIASGVGQNNDAYLVCKKGSTEIDGNGNWGVGDLLIYQNAVGKWIKNDGTPVECLCVFVSEQHDVTFECIARSIQNIPNCDPFNVTVTVYNVGGDFLQLEFPQFVVNTTASDLGFNQQMLSFQSSAMPVHLWPPTEPVRSTVTANHNEEDHGRFVYDTNGTFTIERDFILSAWEEGRFPPKLIGARGVDFVYIGS
jgi:hypothetical protein